MRTNIFSRVLALVAIIAVFSATEASAFWPFSSGSYKGDKSKTEVIAITGNYEKPRLLAELVLKETNQPYILLPATGQSQIFLCTSKGAVEISEASFSQTLIGLNPKLIVVYGNTSYVPEKYLRLIPLGLKTTVLSTDWRSEAASLQKYLGTSRLQNEYTKGLDKIEKTQPTPPPAAATPAPAAEKLAI